MPTIPELAKYLFEDFAMENSRRTPLTVLGEHAFGMEQGRIVTGLEATAAPAGGGTDVPETQPKTPPCLAPSFVSYTTSYLMGKCGYSVLHTHATTGGDGCSFGAYEDCFTWDGPAGFYLTRTLVLTGGSDSSGPSCPDNTHGPLSGTLTYVDTKVHPFCASTDSECSGALTYGTASIGCPPDHPSSFDCVSADLTYSDEFTDSILWSDLAAYPPTPLEPTTGADLELIVGQQFFPTALSSQPGDYGYAEIEASRTNWRLTVPADYTGNYMKVWVYLETTNYSDEGDDLGTGSDELYNSYEWDRATASGYFFNATELLAVPAVEGVNQRLRLYIKDSTCTRGLNCDVPYTGDPSNPYGDKRCIPAGGF